MLPRDFCEIAPLIIIIAVSILGGAVPGDLPHLTAAALFSPFPPISLSLLTTFLLGNLPICSMGFMYAAPLYNALMFPNSKHDFHVFAAPDRATYSENNTGSTVTSHTTRCFDDME
jgi:hypothetical protein